MMSLWDALRMNMMISYQELVRTFPKRLLFSLFKALFILSSSSKFSRVKSDLSNIFYPFKINKHLATKKNYDKQCEFNWTKLSSNTYNTSSSHQEIFHEKTYIISSN